MVGNNPKYKLLKIVESKSIENKAKFVEIRICNRISSFINENFKKDIEYFENKNKVKVEIIDDNSLIVPDYLINLKNKSKKIIKKIESVSKLNNIENFNENNKNINDRVKIKFKKKKFYKKKFYKKKTK